MNKLRDVKRKREDIQEMENTHLPLNAQRNRTEKCVIFFLLNEFQWNVVLLVVYSNMCVRLNRESF